MKHEKIYTSRSLWFNKLLIKKVGVPYNNKLDLPGGKIEFEERTSEALKRELFEETGIEIIEYELFDLGIFYKVLKFKNKIEINKIDNDSLGSDFYDISTLSKKDLSKIVILELEKLGYKLS